ncbi:uncharacterized protein LOC143465264 [Clavelina lepadiformis]|uniref:Uncharacterized protein n=1 Tax=Clavelina lepadiformis TaxID=159417 RepID=A0ABP0EY07_CLALP
MATVQTTTVNPVMVPANQVMGPVVINRQPNLEIGKKYAGIYNKLGITQIACGVLSIIFQIVLMSVAGRYQDDFAFIATGIWAGVFFLTSGILGVVSGKKPTYCPIVAALTMTIFSALAGGAMFGLELTAALVMPSSYYGDCPGDYTDPWCYTRFFATPIGLHSTQCVISFTAAIVAIVHSAYCCAPTSCCNASYQHPQNVYVTTTAYPGQMPATVLPGQPVTYVYPGQPGTVLQSGQPAYMYQTAGTNPTPYPVQTSPMMGQINQSIGESPPPAYQVPSTQVKM